jgi:uncharacterized protein YihD (DUF1040 family)
MRDPGRIDEILQLLREYWQRQPDLRLGQIVTNISHGYGANTDQRPLDPYFIEDVIMKERLINELVRLDENEEIRS